MIGGSVRLDRGGTITAILALAVILATGAAAQQTAPAGGPATAPAAGGATDAAIEDVLGKQQRMPPLEIVNRLTELLQGDVSKVSTPVRLSAYSALAAANERLAHEARGNRLDPAAERKAQTWIDAAVDACVKGGKTAFAAADHRAAEQAFNQALSYRPTNSEALIGVARVLAKTNRHLQAIERYQDYIKASGRLAKGALEPELYAEMGDVYVAASLWHQAIRAYNDAIRNGGDTDEVAASLAEAYLGRGGSGDAGLALQQIRKAITKKPSQPLYYAKLAELLLIQRLFPEARDQARLGVEIARKWLST
ncbi:MAG: tetratricopeptide repeat protein, partial [Planctomycetes bacterium]|nr:tetratricopeptide repeat protein [Planctomycetota bacterium]